MDANNWLGMAGIFIAAYILLEIIGQFASGESYVPIIHPRATFLWRVAIVCLLAAMYLKL